MQAIQTYS